MFVAYNHTRPLLAVDSSFILKSQCNILSKEYGFSIFASVRCHVLVWELDSFLFRNVSFSLLFEECYLPFIPPPCVLLFDVRKLYEFPGVCFVSCSFVQVNFVFCFSSLLHCQYKTCFQQFSTSVVQLFSAGCAILHFTVGVFLIELNF